MMPKLLNMHTFVVSCKRAQLELAACDARPRLTRATWIMIVTHLHSAPHQEADRGPSFFLHTRRHVIEMMKDRGDVLFRCDLPTAPRSGVRRRAHVVRCADSACAACIGPLPTTMTTTVAIARVTQVVVVVAAAAATTTDHAGAWGSNP